MRRSARTILLVGIVFVLVLALAGTGSARKYPPDQNGDIVKPKIITRPAAQEEVQPARQVRLPITGGDALLLVIIGTAVIGSGIFLVRRSRRKTAGV